MLTGRCTMLMRLLVPVLGSWPMLGIAQQPGATVVVLREPTLTSGGKVLTRLASGEAFFVKDVRGDQLLVSSVQTGWIRGVTSGTP
jgi:hypothetical protein